MIPEKTEDKPEGFAEKSTVEPTVDQVKETDLDSKENTVTLDKTEIQ